MQMTEIKERAKQFGLKTSRQSKANIIRQIQKVEGNFDCFSSPTDGFCDQFDCLWRTDCFKSAKATKN